MSGPLVVYRVNLTIKFKKIKKCHLENNVFFYLKNFILFHDGSFLTVLMILVLFFLFLKFWFNLFLLSQTWIWLTFHPSLWLQDITRTIMSSVILQSSKIWTSIAVMNLNKCRPFWDFQVNSLKFNKNISLLLCTSMCSISFFFFLHFFLFRSICGFAGFFWLLFSCFFFLFLCFLICF